MLHAWCIILRRKQKTHSYKHMSFHFSFTFLPLHEKKSYHTFYHNTTSNNHTCYTIHIQPILETSYLDKTHTPPYTFLNCCSWTWEGELSQNLTGNTSASIMRSTKHIQSILENWIRGDVGNVCGPSYSFDTFSSLLTTGVCWKC